MGAIGKTRNRGCANFTFSEATAFCFRYYGISRKLFAIVPTVPLASSAEATAPS
jgi:hypothetical protein